MIQVRKPGRKQGQQLENWPSVTCGPENGHLWKGILVGGGVQQVCVLFTIEAKKLKSAPHTHIDLIVVDYAVKGLSAKTKERKKDVLLVYIPSLATCHDTGALPTAPCCSGANKGLLPPGGLGFPPRPRPQPVLWHQLISKECHRMCALSSRVLLRTGWCAPESFVEHSVSDSWRFSHKGTREAGLPQRSLEWS